MTKSFPITLLARAFCFHIPVIYVLQLKSETRWQKHSLLFFYILISGTFWQTYRILTVYNPGVGGITEYLLYIFPFSSGAILGAFAHLRKATIRFVMSVRTEQLGSHWTDFHEIWCLSIFRKPIENIKVSLQLDSHNGHFTWRQQYFIDNVSLNSSWNEKWFGQNLHRNSKHTFYVSNLFFENRAVYELMWSNIVGREKRTDDNMAHAHCRLDT